MMNSGLVLTSTSYVNLAERGQKDPVNGSILPILGGLWSLVWNKQGITTVYDVVQTLVEVIDPMPVYSTETIDFVAHILNTAVDSDVQIDSTEFTQVIHSGGLDVYYMHGVTIPKTVRNAMLDTIDLKILCDALQTRVTSFLSINLKLHYKGQN